MNNDNGNLCSPDNFGILLANRIYRSALPRSQHFTFLASLGLKTIIYLSTDALEADYLSFISDQKIVLHQFALPSSKDDSISPPLSLVTAALSKLLEADGEPILVHCQGGKHRTGVLVGIWRRVYCQWSIEQAVTGYLRYASPKERLADIDFIQQFDIQPLLTLSNTHSPKSNDAKILSECDLDVIRNERVFHASDSVIAQELAKCSSNELFCNILK